MGYESLTHLRPALCTCCQLIMYLILCFLSLVSLNSGYIPIFDYPFTSLTSPIFFLAFLIVTFGPIIECGMTFVDKAPTVSRHLDTQ